MKYGVSSYVWVTPFTDRDLGLLDKVKAMGFDALEICIEDMATINVPAIARAAGDAGVKALVCGSFGPERDIACDDSAKALKGLDYIRFCIDVAAGLGAPCVSGPMYSYTGCGRLRTPDEKRRQWDQSLGNMVRAAEYAKAAEVKLAVEPLNRFETDFINTVDQGNEFFDQIGYDNVGFLLDTFHMNIEEKSIAGAIKKAGKRVFNFHACNNDRGVPQHGVIDWDGVKRALDDVGYDGYITIEAFTPEIKEIAAAVCMWRSNCEYPDQIPSQGLTFLKEIFE